MNKLMILGCLFFAAITLLALAATYQLPSLRSLRRAFGYPAGQLAVNALGDGIRPDGILSKKADAALTVKHYLVKTGTDADHIAVIAAASDEPLGVCID